MLFYVLTDVLFVIFMLASYVWLRAIHAEGWFPQGTKLPDDHPTSCPVDNQPSE